MIPYLHYHKDKKDLVKSYLIALLPLLIFGFYKNGVLLYQNDLIKASLLFLPLYFYGISGIVAVIVAKIMKEETLSYFFMGLVAASTISINTNALFYPIILFIALFITSCLKKKFCFNGDSLIHIILLLALLFNSYSYLNILEKLDRFNYDLFDVFIGHSASGIASSSLLLVILGFIILSVNKFYKKIIPVSATLGYIVVTVLLSTVLGKDALNIIFNGTVYFGFVFVAASISDTPNNKVGMLSYGLLIGLISGIISVFNIYEASFIGIFITSLFIPLINKMTNKKYLHK